MEKTPNAPRSLILSTRLYQALLVIYPSEFRQAYGGPMLQVFGDSCRRALREAGPAGLLSLWWRTVLDTVQTAIEEHSQQGVDMSKEKFIKLSGWALILGGLVLLLGLLASSRPDYSRFNPRSLPIDRYVNAAEFPLYFMGLILLSLGFTGLFLRYGERTGSFGRFSLGMSALSGLTSAVGVIGLYLYDQEPWWSIFFLGTVLQFLGLVLFGIANVRQRTLPRWNGLPIFAGIWLPLTVLLSIVVEQVNGRFVELPPVILLIAWLLTLAGLVGLGYLLQSDSQPAGMAAAGG